MKQFKTLDGKHTLTRLSRWITINTTYNVSERNSLFEFVADEYGYHPHENGYDPTGGTYLDYFRFGGRTYAINQFVSLGSVWVSDKHYRFRDTDGTISSVDAVDMYGDLYDPLYIEFDEYGGAVRVYKIVWIKIKNILNNSN